MCLSNKAYMRLNILLNNKGKRKTTANKALAIAGGQWLMEVLCFYFTFVLADSLVLRNARHRN